jgi:hypothetical protein
MFNVDFVVVELNINSTLRGKWCVPSFASPTPPSTSLTMMSLPQVDTSDSAPSIFSTDTLKIAYIAIVLFRMVPYIFANICCWRTVDILSSMLEWLSYPPMALNALDTYRKDQFLSEASLELMSGFDRVYLR